MAKYVELTEEIFIPATRDDGEGWAELQGRRLYTSPLRYKFSDEHAEMLAEQWPDRVIIVANSRFLRGSSDPNENPLGREVITFTKAGKELEARRDKEAKEARERERATVTA